MGKSKGVISFEEYCTKYRKDPSSGHSKRQYDRFVANTKDDLSDKLKKGKTPPEIFDGKK
jgi:hypothetical protein